VAEHPEWRWDSELSGVVGGPDEAIEIIAHVYADDGELLERRGRTIAASPALLEACREVRAALDDYRKWRGDCKPWIEDEALIRTLDAVIRQATEDAAEPT
jgi:hypothetical protein